MRDQISISRANDLHPKVRQEVIDTIDYIEESLLPKNAAIRLVQTGRSIEYQNDLYALGRTKINPDGLTTKKPKGNIVTNAKGGTSFHNYFVAFDFAIMYDIDGNGTYEKLSWDLIKDLDADGIKDWDEVVNAFKEKGWEWGGNWKSIKDYPHLQKTFGYTWQKLFAMYNARNFISGTKYLNI